ncbi:4-hydroxythreonine-4-phosphate dehydrogenase PdxA [Pseudokineococcus marinus]|uniref:4-hydroxythreonine-4-phosphate dehydrogenase n=1 Tax=Pseudokineococcus marinus TaxID=351215 RepID=A0A849BNL5_9ACTN|nr:4-hydroxythreonine-4-phosphate dehydrogenase PdxA [Pseudokineococcus marinus]NNH22637.1 4-hydroxythreonine-4-phosphate dehydrogenase [Pseudokineococcus marinus]
MSPTTAPTTRPRIALTLGDPSGIGPELAAKLVADPANRAKADILVLASAAELDAAAAEAGVEVPHGPTAGPDAVAVVGSDLADQPVARGRVSVEGGRRAMADLESALAVYERGEADAIVFTPLNKAALSLAGMAHEDELRWFAHRLGFTGTTSELNLVPGLTTSRVTSHIPISEVASCISAHKVAEAARLLNTVVAAQGVERPRLAVCALNPHAGEGGKFGSEEIDHIAPAVALLRSEGVDAQGPFPCDTLFIRAREGEFDGVVTMYHDQGQIAMKLMGFEQGVTVQGGLPVPIATPAHGTAYGIVGQGVATLGPTQRAFDVALEMAQRDA